MLSASKEYKEIMNRKIRNRAYISVALGVINQKAQESAFASGEYIAWSDLEYPFNDNNADTQYATLEQNFLNASGDMYFLPEGAEEPNYPYKKGVITNNILGEIKIEFDGIYDVKGLTLEFEKNCYPTSFEVITEEKTLTYTNNGVEFKTSNVLGETSYIIIKPLEMIGGEQRFRLNKIVMGINLDFGNDEVKEFSLEEFVHSVSEELPSINATLTVLDKDNRFNIDDEDSYINFFEAEQVTTLKCGLELDDETIEWIDLGSLLLSEWNSQKGTMQLTVKDKISFWSDTYSAGNHIRERTLYDEAINVFTDLGLGEDEYEVDQCLKNITIVNPLPEATHAECLQLIANAGRCTLSQKVNGKVCIRANFATILDPTDITIEANEQSEWSNVENVKYGSEHVYADMTQNFFSLDESMYFLPNDEQEYLKTGFVSASVSDENGNFEINPTITLTLPAGYVYYGVYLNFDGNPPQEAKITTYYYDELQEENTFDITEKETIISHEFKIFDKMVIEFTKGQPNNRVLINKIAFGDLSDYVLTKDNMYEQPYISKEELKKEVRVKLFTYENDENGEPQEVKDNNYYVQKLNEQGSIVTFENALISTEEHAQLVAEWLGNYYKNNISYSIGSYRGEPRIQSSDIIIMDNEYVSDMQVEVSERKLTFNGAFGGSLELRRALKMMEG